MKNIELKKELFDELAGYETYTTEILLDGVKVGRADVIVPPEEESDQVYVEWIGIDEEYRNQGIGTQVINMLAEEYGFIYFAPCDEDNVRLYERIAEEMTEDTPEVDQGFGVYFLEK